MREVSQRLEVDFFGVRERISGFIAGLTYAFSALFGKHVSINVHDRTIPVSYLTEEEQHD